MITLLSVTDSSARVFNKLFASCRRTNTRWYILTKSSRDHGQGFKNMFARYLCKRAPYQVVTSWDRFTITRFPTDDVFTSLSWVIGVSTNFCWNYWWTASKRWNHQYQQSSPLLGFYNQIPLPILRYFAMITETRSFVKLYPFPSFFLLVIIAFIAIISHQSLFNVHFF